MRTDMNVGRRSGMYVPRLLTIAVIMGLLVGTFNLPTAGTLREAGPQWPLPDSYAIGTVSGQKNAPVPLHIDSVYRNITPDGNSGDWDGIAPAYEDYPSDSSGGIDLLSVSICHDSGHIYMLINLAVNVSESSGVEILYGQGNNGAGHSLYPSDSLGTSHMPSVYTSLFDIDLAGSTRYYISEEGNWTLLNDTPFIAAFNASAGILEFSIETNSTEDVHLAIIGRSVCEDTYAEVDAIPQNCDISYLDYKPQKLTEAIVLPPHIQTMLVDGSLADWEQFGIKPAYVDSLEYTGMGGTEEIYDIKSFWMAHDSQYAYFAVQFAGDIEAAASSPTINGAIGFFFSRGNASGDNTGEVYSSGTGSSQLGTDDLSFGYTYGVVWMDMFSSWLSRAWVDNSGGIHSQINYYGGRDYFAFSGNVFEMKIPLFGEGGLNISDYGESISFGLGSAKNTGGMEDYTDIDTCPDNISTYHFKYRFVAGSNIELKGSLRTDLTVDGDLGDWENGTYDVINSSLSMNSTEVSLNGIYLANNLTSLFFAFNFSGGLSPADDFSMLMPFSAMDLIDEYMSTDTILYRGERYILSMPCTHVINITSTVTSGRRITSATISTLYSNGVPAPVHVPADVAISEGAVELSVKLSLLPPPKQARTLMFWIITDTPEWHLVVPSETGRSHISYVFLSSGEGDKSDRAVYLTTHFRHINIDGDISDWGNITPYYDDTEYLNWSTDEDGDGQPDIFGKNVDPGYVDIKSVRVANDLNKLYIAVEFVGNIANTVLENDVGFSLLTNAPPSSPYWNATPPLEPSVHSIEYEFISPDKRMVDTGDMGFEAGYCIAWFSSFPEFTPYADNHVRKFYYSKPYFTQVENYAYRVAAAKDNVIELGIPLYEHGLDLKDCNFTLKFNIVSYVVESAIQPWSVDAAPYDNGPNATPGSKGDDTCKYFVYRIGVNERDLLIDSYTSKYIQSSSDISGLSEIDGSTDIVNYLGGVLSTIDERWQSSLLSGDISSMEMVVDEISTLERLNELVYRAMEYRYFTDALSMWYDLDTAGLDGVIGDIESIASLILTDTDEANYRIDVANEIIDRLDSDISAVVPPIKVAIFDSDGTNNYREKAWDNIETGASSLGPFRVEIDHISLDREDIGVEDILATNASVVVIDNSMARGKNEVLTPAEIEAVKRYVAVYGGSLVGTGNTLATALLPEHRDMMVLFGLDEDMDTFSSIPVSSDFSFYGGSIAMRYGIAPDSYVSALTIGMANFEINRSRASYIAVSSGNDSAVIESRYGVSRNVYFTLPVSDLKPYGGRANSQDIQMLYNAIVYASGLLDITGLYSRLSTISTPMNITPLSNDLKDAMQNGEYHTAKQILMKWCDTEVLSIIKDNLDCMDSDVGLITTIQYPDAWSVKNDYDRLLNELHSLMNLSLSDTRVHDNMLLFDEILETYEESSVLMHNISITAEDARRWFESALNKLSSLLLDIRFSGFDTSRLSAELETAYEAYYGGDYSTAATIAMVDIPAEIEDLYYGERYDIKRRIDGVRNTNIFYNVGDSESYLERSDAAYNSGNISLAFSLLGKAKSSLDTGIPATVPVGLILLLIILGAAAYVSRGRVLPRISVGGIFRTHLMAGESINIGLVNSTDAHMDAEVVSALSGVKGTIYAVCDDVSAPYLKGLVPMDRTILVDGRSASRKGDSGYIVIRRSSSAQWINDVLLVLSNVIQSEQSSTGGKKTVIYLNISSAISDIDDNTVRSFMRHIINRSEMLGIHLVGVYDASVLGAEKAYLHALDFRNTYLLSPLPKLSFIHYIKENRIRDYLTIKRSNAQGIIKPERVREKVLPESIKLEMILIPHGNTDVEAKAAEVDI